MKGLIIIGKIKKERETIMSRMLAERLGFDILLLDSDEDNFTLPSGVGIVICYLNRNNKVACLRKGVKLITWERDIHFFNDAAGTIKEKKKDKKALYERSDLILSASYEYFEKSYSKYMNKMVFMPLYFAPHERYMNIKFNKNPKMKCLLSGNSRGNVYPIRSVVRRKIETRPDSERILDMDVHVIEKKTKTQKQRWKYMGDDYARWLNQYFCCVTDSSVYNYVVSKYFEIPAAGSLLLANETEDADRAGLIPNEHYLPITRQNVIQKIKKCLKDPRRYEGIRREGMEFVRKNHSINNRIAQIKQIVKERL